MSAKNYVYEAVIRGIAGDQSKEWTQLFAAISLRRALIKAEQFMEAAELDGAEIVGLVKKQDLVI